MISSKSELESITKRYQGLGIYLNQDFVSLLHQHETESDHISYKLELCEVLIDEIQKIRQITQREMLSLRAGVLLSTLLTDKITPKSALQKYLDNFAESVQSQIESIVRFCQQEHLEGDLTSLGDLSESSTLVIAIFRLITSFDASLSHSTSIIAVENYLDGLQIRIDGPRVLSDLISSQAASRHLASILQMPIFIYCDRPLSIGQVGSLPIDHQSIGITLNDEISEACRKILRFHFARMIYHEPGTRRGVDPEELHDMRVATRRLRSALGTFRSIVKKKLSKHFMADLRIIGDALGNVRDVDVFFENLTIDIEAIPQISGDDLSALIVYWQGKRVFARKQMLEHLDSDRYKNFLTEFNRFVNTPFWGLKKKDVSGRAQTRTPAILINHYKRVRAFNGEVVNAPVDTLHRLRIEVKKFRYAVEFFGDVLGSGCEDLITDLKQIQDHLGMLNDAVVATGIIKEFIENFEAQVGVTNPTDQPEQESARKYLHSKQKQLDHLLITFPDTWDDFIKSDFEQKFLYLVESL